MSVNNSASETAATAGIRQQRRKRASCKEPVLAEYTSRKEFDAAWERWRCHRDRNNSAVKRSRCKHRSRGGSVGKRPRVSAVESKLFGGQARPLDLGGEMDGFGDSRALFELELYSPDQLSGASLSQSPWPAETPMPASSPSPSSVSPSLTTAAARAAATAATFAAAVTAAVAATQAAAAAAKVAAAKAAAAAAKVAAAKAAAAAAEAVTGVCSNPSRTMQILPLHPHASSAFLVAAASAATGLSPTADAFGDESFSSDLGNSSDYDYDDFDDIAYGGDGDGDGNHDKDDAYAVATDGVGCLFGIMPPSPAVPSHVPCGKPASPLGTACVTCDSGSDSDNGSTCVGLPLPLPTTGEYPIGGWSKPDELSDLPFFTSGCNHSLFCGGDQGNSSSSNIVIIINNNSQTNRECNFFDI
jgi:hypothetical protein